MKQYGLPIVAACLLLLFVGCGSDSQETIGLDDLEKFGSLPYLKTTRDQRLADELARIVEEGGTPEQLTVDDDSDTVGAALKMLFSKDELPGIVMESDELMPPREFEFDAKQLKHASDFRKRYNAQRLEAREALKQPQPNLAIRFVAGFSADTSVIDVVRVCVRLEAFDAAEMLAAGKVGGAIGSVEQMLALAQCLASAKHLDSRLHAAYLRAEAMAVMQAIVMHEKTTREDLKALLRIVQVQLQNWTDDAAAWIGERAIGLHTYELVREGALLILLTEQEIDEFQREGDLRALALSARRNADRDQLYYLETMRQVIESCQRPPHSRLPLFESIQQELQQRRGSPDFPFVAGRLLLTQLAAAHAIQSRDRANWEAWALALATATGQNLPQQINPLTGKPFEVAREDSLIVVSGIVPGPGADRIRVYVPDLSKS